MRLLADVNVSGRVVERLRALGWVVDRTSEHVPANAPDQEVLALAARFGAVLLTRDQDFPALLARSGETQPSILNVRCATVDAERLAQLLDRALRAAEHDLRAGAIATIDDVGARVHRLPLG